MHGVTAMVASQHGYTQCVTDSDLIKRGDSWLTNEVKKWTANGKNNEDVLVMFDEREHADTTGRGGSTGKRAHLRCPDWNGRDRGIKRG
ncbi:MAG TPA: hypothetical protein VKU39_12180 [Streptosporangiaceae bacterium]|nr:hypothetical protein [Streptosporangiaceae bacterium]